MKQRIDLNHWARTILLPVICIGIVIFNIFYIIVCIKALSKSFHNLVVIGLCFSDLVTSFEITITCFLTVYFPTNVPSCVLQTFGFSFGMLLSYCLIFLLSLQRYLTVHSYNYGIRKMFDEIKFKCIGGTTIVVFLYTLCTVSLIPRNGAISYCRHYQLYGNYVGAFVVTIFGPAVILICVIVCISVLTSLQIWRIYFSKRKINPVLMTNYNRKEDEPSEKSFVLDQNERESNRQAMTSKRDSVLHEEKQSNSRENGADEPIQSTFKKKRQIQNVDDPKDSQKEIIRIETYQTNMLMKRLNGDHNMFNSAEIVELKTMDLNLHSPLTQHKSEQIKDNRQHRNQEATQNILEAENGQQSNCFIAADTSFTAILTVNNANEKQNTNYSAIQDRNKLSMTRENKNSTKRIPAEKNQSDLISKSRKVWEIRAFITSILIAAQTLLLTGPFVLSFWIELIYPQEVSSQMYMFALPFLVNLLTNPILYAWRMPEIRREFKNLCKRDN